MSWEAALTGAVAGFAGDRASDVWAYKRQKRMQGISHQLEVKDLRKAGLNPILSAMSGPSAGAGLNAPRVSGSAGANVSSAVSAGLQARMQNEAFEKMDTEKAVNTAVAAREYSQKKLNDANARVARANEKLVINSAKNAAVNNDLLKLQVPAASNAAAAADTWIGRNIMPYEGQTMGAGLSAGAKGFKALTKGVKKFFKNWKMKRLFKNKVDMFKDFKLRHGW